MNPSSTQLPTASATRNPTDADPSTRRWARVIVALPDAVLLPLLWLCVTVSATIVLHAFTPWLVLPVAAAASVATWRWRPRFEVTAASTRSATWTIIGIAVWFVGNLPFASTWLYTNQDPGFITLEGLWLRTHANPGIPADGAAHLVATVGGASASTGSFTLHGTVLQAQGAKLVPGLIAVGGWAGGAHGVFVANLVIGAVALLAFFAFARRVVGPLWSVVVVAALAVSMPFVVFTRSPYTEPVVLALAFAGLVFLWEAVRTGNWRGFLCGGALVGAGSLARIDGAALVIGLTLGLGLVAFGTRDGERRRRARIGLVSAVAPAVALVTLGWLDLRLNSPTYLDNLAAQWHELVAGMAVSVVIAVLISWRHPWQPLRRLLAEHRRGIGTVLAAIVIVAAVVLASRPLWLVTHGADNAVVAQLQQSAGLPVDGTRSYDEQSVSWLALYFGWLLVAAGFIGVALALRRGAIERQAGILLALAVIAVPSALYLVQVDNTPVQLWVMRRYLPVTLPGLLLFAAWLGRASFTLVSARMPAGRPRKWGRIGVAVVSVVAFAFPLTTLVNRVPIARQFGGQVALTRAVCAAADNRPVIVLNDGTYFPTVRIMCGVEALQTAGTPTTAQLSQLRAAFPGQTPVVLSFGPGGIPWQGGTPAPTLNTNITVLGQTINTLPRGVGTQQWSLWLGTITADGHVKALPPAPVG